MLKDSTKNNGIGSKLVRLIVLISSRSFDCVVLRIFRKYTKFEYNSRGIMDDTNMLSA